MHGNLRLGHEQRNAGPARSTLTWYGDLPLPWHFPHTRISVLPVSDHSAGLVSLRAAVTEESSGASLVTCASVQRGIAAHPNTLSRGSPVRLTGPGPIHRSNAREYRYSGALRVAVTGTRSPARSTSYPPSASQAEVTGSSRRRYARPTLAPTVAPYAALVT